METRGYFHSPNGAFWAGYAPTIHLVRTISYPNGAYFTDGTCASFLTVGWQPHQTFSPLIRVICDNGRDDKFYSLRKFQVHSPCNPGMSASGRVPACHFNSIAHSYNRSPNVHCSANQYIRTLPYFYLYTHYSCHCNRTGRDNSSSGIFHYQICNCVSSNRIDIRQPGKYAGCLPR